MKNNNAAIGGVFYYIIQAFFGSYGSVKIGTEYIPHYYFVPQPFYFFSLLSVNFAIWRAKQFTVISTMVYYGLPAGFYIFVIYFIFSIPPVNVVKGMIAYGVAAFNNFAEDVRVLFDIVANAKECRFDVVFFQQIENPFRNFGYWSVVKGEINSFLSTGH